MTQYPAITEVFIQIFEEHFHQKDARDFCNTQHIQAQKNLGL